MNSSEATRRVLIVSAVMNAAGLPDFALTQFDVTVEEEENGAHFWLAEQELLARGYEEPFVHFGEGERPDFLLRPLVRPARTPNRPKGATTVRVIQVTVSPKGETTIQTKGYAGADCLRASKFLEEALGVAQADRKTAEFYQEAAAQQEARQ